jgi:hypothetical protein
MDFDTVNEIEMFIETLDSPKKQIITRNLMLDQNYQIKSFTVTKTKELFIKDLKKNQIYKLITFVNSKCNC